MSGGGDTVSDALLMQYMHDELGPVERARLEEELARTPAVADRLHVLKQRTRRLSALLDSMNPTQQEVQASAEAIRPTVIADGAGSHAETTVAAADIVTHTSWWRQPAPALRAAAVVTVLLGGVLLVEPVRAWVLDQVRTAAESVGLISAAPVVETPVTPVAPATGADLRLSFPWSSIVFEISAGSAAGRIVAAAGTDVQVTVEVAGSAGTTLMVTPAGIRIEGASDPEAVFTITLPPVVQTLRLNHDGRIVEHAVPAGGPLLLLLQ
ncbi:MAG: hypothetical protein KFH98_07130 [Gemmatimonadetes bacterium]|nr:hypothetical protein [Gemmatimonadota bacterium]